MPLDLQDVQSLIKMLFKVTCQIEYFIVELFIDELQYLSLCCALYNFVEYTLNTNPMIEVAPKLWP